MKILIERSALLGCSLTLIALLTGCPYQSNVPLDDHYAADWDLSGKWKCQTEGYDISEVEVLNDEYTNIIKVNDGLSENQYRAWRTSIEGDEFLYVEIVKDGKTTYAIYKYTADLARTRTWELNPEVMDPNGYSSTEELRNAVAALKGRDDAFVREAVWVMK